MKHVPTIVAIILLSGLLIFFAAKARRVVAVVERAEHILALMDSAGVDAKCIIIVTEARRPSWDGKKPRGRSLKERGLR